MPKFTVFLKISPLGFFKDIKLFGNAERKYFCKWSKIKVSGKKFKRIFMEFSSGEGIGKWD